jgi:DNA-binding beta-propeller fold protein YncE
MRIASAVLGVVGVVGLLGAFPARGPAHADDRAAAVAIPGGDGGVGFDDLGFARGLRKILIPAGRTGALVLADPASREIAVVSGFSRPGADTGRFAGGHGEGTTSADEGSGRTIFAVDRGTRRLVVVDPAAANPLVGGADLLGGPDYVRYVSAAKPDGGEVWVTEPRGEQIEIFSVSAPRSPTRVATLKVPGGPESLIFDAARKRVYTHQWKSTTHAIDPAARKIVASWKNGCADSRGIALDEARGFLFAGCAEGKASVLDVTHDGKILDTRDAGVTGVDVIAYDAKLGHLYVPGEDSGSMAILGVSAAGKLSVLGKVTTAKGAHCVAADDRDNAWVCDPEHGRLLVFHDSFPPSR